MRQAPYHVNTMTIALQSKNNSFFGKIPERSGEIVFSVFFFSTIVFLSILSQMNRNFIKRLTGAPSRSTVKGGGESGIFVIVTNKSGSVFTHGPGHLVVSG